jgi:hypothetical protein
MGLFDKDQARPVCASLHTWANRLMVGVVDSRDFKAFEALFVNKKKSYALESLMKAERASSACPSVI